MSETLEQIMATIRKDVPGNRARLSLILPQPLHDRVKTAAKDRHMSMNAFLVELLDKILPKPTAH